MVGGVVHERLEFRDNLAQDLLTQLTKSVENGRWSYTNVKEHDTHSIFGPYEEILDQLWGQKQYLKRVVKVRPGFDRMAAQPPQNAKRRARDIQEDGTEYFYDEPAVCPGPPCCVAEKRRVWRQKNAIELTEIRSDMVGTVNNFLWGVLARLSCDFGWGCSGGRFTGTR